MFLVVTFAFIILRVSGDPIEILLGDEAEQDVIAYYQKLYGLDKPIYEQYVHYFFGILKGDLGISLSDERDAVEVVLEAVPATLQLGFTALLVSIMLGVPLGLVAALNRNKAIDRFVMSFSVFGFSIPNFFLGILLILLFSLTLQQRSQFFVLQVQPSVQQITHVGGTLSSTAQQTHRNVSSTDHVMSFQKRTEHIPEESFFIVVDVVNKVSTNPRLVLWKLSQERINPRRVNRYPVFVKFRLPNVCSST